MSGAHESNGGESKESYNLRNGKENRVINELLL